MAPEVETKGIPRIRPGTAFYLPSSISGTPHIAFVLFGPDEYGNVLVVNFSSISYSLSAEDLSCVVEASEYTALDFKSKVAYQHAKEMTVEELTRLLLDSDRRPCAGLPAGVLRRAQDGARKTDNLPYRFMHRYLRDGD